METLHKLVKDYLKTYKSLTIGKLGQLKIVPTSAQIHPIIHTFQPPAVSVDFFYQPQATTEIRFIQYIVIKQNLSEQQAEAMVEQYIHNILEGITTFRKYDFPEIGILQYSESEGYSFEIYPDAISNPDAFGLESFKVEPVTKPSNVIIQKETDIPQPLPHSDQKLYPEKPETDTIASTDDDKFEKTTENASIQPAVEHSETKEDTMDAYEEVVENKTDNQSDETDEKVQISNEPENKTETIVHSPEKKSPKKKFFFVLYAVLIILITASAILYFTGLWETIYQNTVIAWSQKTEQQHEIIQHEVTPSEHAEDIVFIDENQQAISDEITQIVEEKGTYKQETTTDNKYFIVGGSFQNKDLATSFVETLQSQGHQRATIADITRGGLHIVAYAGFKDKHQAEQELQRIQKDLNPDVWLYTKQ